MSHLSAAGETITDAKTDVSSLIIQGVFGIDAHQTALSVLAVERSLRTAKHVSSAKLVGVHVEHALADEGNVVDIDSNGRTVDT